MNLLKLCKNLIYNNNSKQQKIIKMIIYNFNKFKVYRINWTTSKILIKKYKTKIIFLKLI